MSPEECEFTEKKKKKKIVVSDVQFGSRLCPPT